MCKHTTTGHARRVVAERTVVAGREGGAVDHTSLMIDRIEKGASHADGEQTSMACACAVRGACARAAGALAYSCTMSCTELHTARQRSQ